MIDLTFTVWRRYFPKSFEGKCLCCGEPMHYPEFHKGHIIADAEGGEYNVSNLIPIHMSCNAKMGKTDFFTFKKKYFPEIVVDIPIERRYELLQKENELLIKQKQQYDICFSGQKIKDLIIAKDDKEKENIVDSKCDELSVVEVREYIGKLAFGNKDSFKGRNFRNTRSFKIPDAIGNITGIYAEVMDNGDCGAYLYLGKGKETFENIYKDKQIIEDKFKGEGINIIWGNTSRGNYQLRILKNFKYYENNMNDISEFISNVCKNMDDIVIKYIK